MLGEGTATDPPQPELGDDGIASLPCLLPPHPTPSYIPRAAQDSHCQRGPELGSTSSQGSVLPR